MSIIIKANPNDNNDSLMRKFQKKVIMEGVLQEYRDLSYHKKKSELRQEKRKEKQRKIMRAKRLSSSL